MISKYSIHSIFPRTLTTEQADELTKLIMTCRRESGCSFYADLDDCGEDYKFSRFFFYYNNSGLLVHASWISVLSGREWNLFSFTHPEYRKQGCLQEALLQLKNELSQMPRLPHIYIPVSPENEPAVTILQKLSGQIAYSDYLMEIDPHTVSADAFPLPSGLVREEFAMDDGSHCLFYHLRTSSDLSDSQGRRRRKHHHTGTIQEIGSCMITEKGGFCFLSHLEIKKKYRNRGFGTLLMSNMLKTMAQKQIVSLKLHTDSRNVPAIRLYQKLGFSIIQQIDMWEIPEFFSSAFSNPQPASR